jgi:toxin ParE1/3/4
MDFKVVFSDTFIADLEGIIRSVAIQNPDAARRLGESIVAAAERLGFFPERHPKVRQRPGIRRFIIARYFKVFYRIGYASNTVEVLRCWDGRREHDPAA